MDHKYKMIDIKYRFIIVCSVLLILAAIVLIGVINHRKQDNIAQTSDQSNATQTSDLSEITDSYDAGWLKLLDSPTCIYPVPEETEDSGLPEYLDDYTAPSVTDYDITKAQFILDGKPYQLPCPVKEFLDDGWKIDTSQGDTIPAGKLTSGMLTITKDKYSLQAGLANYWNDHETKYEDSAIYYITYKRSSDCNPDMPDDFIKFTDNANIGSLNNAAREELRNLGFKEADTDKPGIDLLYQEDMTLGVDLHYTDDSIYGAIIRTTWDYGKSGHDRNSETVYSKYREYLESAELSDDVHWAYGYVDDDLTPELFYSEGSYHVSGVHVCTYDEKTDKVIHIGEFSSCGRMLYNQKKNRIISQYGNHGFFRIYVSAIQDNRPVLIGAVTEDGSKEDILYYAGYPVPETMDGTKRDINDDDLKGASEEYLVSEETYLEELDRLEDKGSGSCLIDLSYDMMEGQIIE